MYLDIFVKQKMYLDICSMLLVIHHVFFKDSGYTTLLYLKIHNKPGFFLKNKSGFCNTFF